MKIALVTLCLNEEQFLEKNFQQHTWWPGLAAWIFVEGADPLYAKATPGKVTENGLSTDRTGEILDAFPKRDSRIIVSHYGWMQGQRSTENKSEGRNVYMRLLDSLPTSFDAIIVIDADEFYSFESQRAINHIIENSREDILAWRFRQRHLWCPPSISKESENLFRYEVVGGYWGVPHTRVFRYRPYLRYLRSHNYPEGPDYHPLRHLLDLSERGAREKFRGATTDPVCLHLGFARRGDERGATNRYYVERGEGKGDGRESYVNCRAAWETWDFTPLPNGAKVIPYLGPIAECYIPNPEEAKHVTSPSRS